MNPLELRLAALSQQPVPVDTGTGCIVLEPLSTAAWALIQAGEVDTSLVGVGMLASSIVSATPLCPDLEQVPPHLALLGEWGKLQVTLLQAFRLPAGYMPIPASAHSWHTPVFKYLLIPDGAQLEYEEDIKHKYTKWKHARENQDNE